MGPVAAVSGRCVGMGPDTVEGLSLGAINSWHSRELRGISVVGIQAGDECVKGVQIGGAFALADELQLPVVPLTINGSFNVMPRTKDWHFATWHPLKLTIHQAIYPIGQGPDNVDATLRQAYDSVMSSLNPKYQGLVENPDQ